MWLLACVLAIAGLSLTRPVLRAFVSESAFLLLASGVMVVTLFQFGRLG
jgi:hypothetical protein